MHVLQLLLGLLPASRAKNRLLSLTSRRWSIHPTARLGPTVIWRVRELRVHEGAVLGVGNVLRRLQQVELHPFALISQLNWFSGEASAVSRELVGAGTLVLGEHSGITSRHLIDCSGGFTLGRFATMGGHRTQVLTHGPDLDGNVIRCLPVTIGSYALVGTSCVIVAGITIADRVVVGAGSVVVRDLTQPETIYAGSPAVARSDLSSRDIGYFTRTRGTLMAPEERARRVQEQQRRS